MANYTKMAKQEKRPARRKRDSDVHLESVPTPGAEWKPTTDLGKQVKEGKVSQVEDIFKQGLTIMEAEIVDTLLPKMDEDLLLIGQAKGKFGGGQRRIFRQTQKKTKEGNRMKFTTYAVIGNRNGFVGLGMGKSKETVPSRDKSRKKAKLSLIMIRRGCGSWQCHCKQPHSIPFEIQGRCGSSRITLLPAPRGKGLCIEKECAKVLALAGVKDVWSRTYGQTKTKVNLVGALVDALKKLSQMKVKPGEIESCGIIEGRIPEAEALQHPEA